MPARACPIGRSTSTDTRGLPGEAREEAAKPAGEPKLVSRYFGATPTKQPLRIQYELKNGNALGSGRQ